jgi:hypothetical protein
LSAAPVPVDDPPTPPPPDAGDPSRWEDDPCRDTPPAVVLIGITLAVLGPLAAAVFFAV